MPYRPLIELSKYAGRYKAPRLRAFKDCQQTPSTYVRHGVRPTSLLDIRHEKRHDRENVIKIFINPFFLVDILNLAIKPSL